MKFELVELYKKIKTISGELEDNQIWKDFETYIKQLRDNGYSFKYVGISLMQQSVNVFEFDNCIICKIEEIENLKNQAIKDKDYNLAAWFREEQRELKNDKCFITLKICTQCVFIEKENKIIHYHILSNHDYYYRIQDILR